MGQITLLKSKIHQAIVSEVFPKCTGSIFIPKSILEKSNILPYEKVTIVNNDNGTRLEAYVEESNLEGIITTDYPCRRGDQIIIMSYAITEGESVLYKPKIVFIEPYGAYNILNRIKE